jgi:hypothetical protein
MYIRIKVFKVMLSLPQKILCPTVLKTGFVMCLVLCPVLFIVYTKKFLFALCAHGKDLATQTMLCRVLFHTAKVIGCHVFFGT